MRKCILIRLLWKGWNYKKCWKLEKVEKPVHYYISGDSNSQMLNWSFHTKKLTISKWFVTLFSRSFLVCLRFFACNTAIIFPAQAWTWYSKYHCTTALTEFRIKIMFGISINGHPQSFFHQHKVFIPPTLCYAFCKSFEIGEKLSSPQVKRVSTWITLTSTTEVIIGSNRTE